VEAVAADIGMVAAPLKECERRFFLSSRSKSIVSLNLFYIIIGVLLFNAIHISCH
jgi:hypothetical protein